MLIAIGLQVAILPSVPLRTSSACSSPNVNVQGPRESATPASLWATALPRESIFKNRPPWAVRRPWLLLLQPIVQPVPGSTSYGGQANLGVGGVKTLGRPREHGINKLGVPPYTMPSPSESLFAEGGLVDGPAGRGKPFNSNNQDES